MNMRPCVRACSADEIAPVHFSLCDGAELETRPKGEHEGATARQVDDILLEMKDNDNDNDTLREVPHLSDEGLALQARV